jgi:predicted Zn-dependent peptidase
MEMVGSKFEQTIFGNNALGRDIIGSKKTVQSVSKANLLFHRDKYYTAQNAVLTLAGNFSGMSENEIVKLAGKSFKLSQKKTARMPEIEMSDYPTQKSNIVIKKTEQSHLVIGFKTVPISHPDCYKLELLATLLGGSMSSRMFEEIREKRGLAYAVRTSSENYIESGFIETQAGVHHSKVGEAVKAIIGEYKKLKTEKVSASELNKSKEVIIGKMLIKFEDSEELASNYALDEILLDKIDTPEEMIRIYRKITPQEILETAKKYLTGEKLGLAFIGPKFDQKYLENIHKL